MVVRVAKYPSNDTPRTLSCHLISPKDYTSYSIYCGLVSSREALTGLFLSNLHLNFDIISLFAEASVHCHLPVRKSDPPIHSAFPSLTHKLRLTSKNNKINTYAWSCLGDLHVMSKVDSYT
ncbi:hypothetical protein B0O99DRAFT_184147 [Bisporella sp. PMI_857]|nr:hypothetical protein B0O99DRAFT_184147 [Bisporella sp. PMI_857]